MTCSLGDITFNIFEICRICMRKDDELLNIFLTSGDEPTTAASLIFTFGNTLAHENDGLPAQICKTCRENLNSCYKFRQLIQRNYETLRLCCKNEGENKDFDLSIDNFLPSFEADQSPEIKIVLPVKKESGDESCELEFTQEDLPNFETDLSDSDDYKPEKKKISKRNLRKKSVSKKVSSRKKRSEKDNAESKKVKKEAKIENDVSKKKRDKGVKNKVPDINDKLTAALQKRLENRDKCPLCFEKLKANETMAEHFYSHYNSSNLTPLIVNGKKTSTCNLCNRDYKFNSMIPHHRKHLKLYPFKCEIPGCNKAFASTMNLGWHLDNHNGVKKYQCQTCGKTFHLSGSLRNHEETHIIERAQCKICHKTYKNHIMLKLHMKRHIYGQRHKCEVPGCDKAFYSAQELRRHSHTHYGSKTFVCDVCSKPWYTEKELIRHKKYHDPVKAHQCSECMKTFVDKSQLRCHEMTHRGERPHVCEFCSTGFITKSKLKRHQMKSCKGAKHYQLL